MSLAVKIMHHYVGQSNLRDETAHNVDCVGMMALHTLPSCRYYCMRCKHGLDSLVFLSVYFIYICFMCHLCCTIVTWWGMPGRTEV